MTIRIALAIDTHIISTISTHCSACIIISSFWLPVIDLISIATTVVSIVALIAMISPVEIIANTSAAIVKIIMVIAITTNTSMHHDDSYPYFTILITVMPLVFC